MGPIRLLRSACPNLRSGTSKAREIECQNTAKSVTSLNLFKFYEVQDYLSITQHAYAPLALNSDTVMV